MLSCPASWSFRYDDKLTGSALRPKLTAGPLADGRAWGVAVAEWHRTGDLNGGMSALDSQLEEAAVEWRGQGLYDAEQHAKTRERLAAILAHYAHTAERIDPLEGLEREIVVAIPARSGRRASPKYRLQAFLDGSTRDEAGRPWVVEFKLRSRLYTLRQVALSQQPRWYAWAWWQSTGIMPAGVIVDERLNEAPSPVNFNKDGRPSKVQTCRLDDYIAAWQELGAEPDRDVVAKLAARPWQQRHHIRFRPHELEQVGWQLVSVARQIRMLEAGELLPVRNAQPRNCAGCPFVEICDDPEGNGGLIEAVFDRVPAKRHREIERQAA